MNFIKIYELLASTQLYKLKKNNILIIDLV